MTRRVLTERQWDVLYGASHGETAAETAERLKIAVDTVKDHRKALLERLEARSMAEATGAAIRRGVLP